HAAAANHGKQRPESDRPRQGDQGLAYGLRHDAPARTLARSRTDRYSPWPAPRRRSMVDCPVIRNLRATGISGQARAARIRTGRSVVFMAPSVPTPQHMPARDPRPPLTVLLAAPRGFCAGVDRAIKIVELALKRFGPPVYVRHEIVHNRHVVESLKAKGAIFVEELDEIPETGAPVIFSAHGVPQSVPGAAQARGLNYLDATCPLVSKVHVEARAHHAEGLEIVLIGHAGHPEVVGTLGQLPAGAATL